MRQNQRLPVSMVTDPVSMVTDPVSMVTDPVSMVTDHFGVPSLSPSSLQISGIEPHYCGVRQLNK